MAKKLFFFAPAAGYTVYRNNYIIIKPRVKCGFLQSRVLVKKCLQSLDFLQYRALSYPVKSGLWRKQHAKSGLFYRRVGFWRNNDQDQRFHELWASKTQKPNSVLNSRLCIQSHDNHNYATVPILISRSTKAHGWWPQVNNSCPMHYWIKWFWT